jgi:hypothetical protein
MQTREIQDGGDYIEYMTKKLTEYIKYAEELEINKLK